MIPSTKRIEKQERALSWQYDATANGDEVSFWDDKNGVKLDYGEDFTTQ